MNTEVKRYKITIGGESYFLVSDESEEHLKSVALYVDEQMKLVAQSGYIDDPKRLAVLVALQCASKMVNTSELLAQYQANNDRLLEVIAQEVS